MQENCEYWSGKNAGALRQEFCWNVCDYSRLEVLVMFLLRHACVKGSRSWSKLISFNPCLTLAPKCREQPSHHPTDPPSHSPTSKPHPRNTVWPRFLDSLCLGSIQDCPLQDLTCELCGLRGHLENMCRSSQIPSNLALGGPLLRAASGTWLRCVTTGWLSHGDAKKHEKGRPKRPVDHR